MNTVSNVTDSYKIYLFVVTVADYRADQRFSLLMAM